MLVGLKYIKTLSTAYMYGLLYDPFTTYEIICTDFIIQLLVIDHGIFNSP